ncbi:MAG: hypothetical protein M1376_22520 [Planctomycetes bacterium]|nr:hypothetical protein [Planctomycetota bacterium]
MGAGKTVGLYIVVMAIAAMSLVAWTLLSSLTRPVYRIVPERDVRATLGRFVDWTLPDELEATQAMFHSYRGYEEMFVAFTTSEEGWKSMLNAVTPHASRREEFPSDGTNPLQWDMHGFIMGCLYQEKLGINVFDRLVLDKITADDMDHVSMGTYPKDVTRVSYLASGDVAPARWRVLVFTDRSLVYIFAAKPSQ